MNSTSKAVIVFLTFLIPGASVYAQSPRAELQQMVEQLRRSPNDDALRDKLIKLAADIKPAPAIPKEARRPFVMAETFQKSAKIATDFNPAISAYEEALALAPWWGDAYYNLSVSLESAGRLGEARRALKRYLLSKPVDAERAEDRLYALEAKEVVAAKNQAQRARTLIVPGVSIGPARIGMTFTEAKAALGPPTDQADYDNNNGYRGVGLTWGVRPNSIYMDFYKYQPTEWVNTGQAQFTTAEGVGPGMPLSQALALQGTPAKSKNFGAIVQTCYSNGIALGNSADSTKVDFVIVFPPATLNKICPD